MGFLESRILERVTEAAKSIYTDHAYIHEGKMYSASIVPTSIAAGATRKLTFVTPPSTSNIYVHWRPSIVACSADKLTINFYEASSGNSGGTALTAVNRNRLSAHTASSVVTDGVTVTTNGDFVDRTYIGGGSGVGGSVTGAETGETNEIILKQNTIHTIELINNSSSANIVFIKLLWYEESMA